MGRKLLLLIVFFLATSAYGQESSKEEELKPTALSTEEMQLVLEINKKLTESGLSVSSCTQKGGRWMSCLCENLALSKEVKKLVRDAFKKYPHWRKYEVIRFKTEKAISVVKVKDLINVAEHELECGE